MTISHLLLSFALSAIHIPAGMAACPDAVPGHAVLELPDPGLTCIPLFAAPAVPDARGAVHLLPGRTPFGISVTRDGVMRNRFVIEAKGLPDPGDLGPYTRYVAWITPPSLFPMIALGEVTNGRVELSEGALDRYLVLISAEGPHPVVERTGPLVLRGTSPTMVLRPHDLPYILAEMAGGGAFGGEADRVEGDSEVPSHVVHDGHASHGARGALLAQPTAGAPSSPVEWRPPPMHPDIAMPHEMMRLRPRMAPLLPFETGVAIPDARPRESIRLLAGDTLLLDAGPVMRRIGGLSIPGYGFNGQSPGPLIEAEEGSTVHVRFRNRTPLPSAIHWHGIRLEAAFDGVPGVTQAPVAPGDAFDYELRLPDEGTFWYHPHLREDVMQDLGLAGNVRVHPAGAEGASLYAPVDREEYLVLDDHLIGPEGPVPYGTEGPIHALMGRFGNVLLVNGSDDWRMDVRPGEVVRFHLTNVASTRTFNLSVGHLPIKVVASDMGKLPEDAWVESVVIAPAERWVVDVRFPAEGRIALENRVQALDHMGGRFFPEFDTIGEIQVRGEAALSARSSAGEGIEEAFARVRSHSALQGEVWKLVEAHRDRDPDRTLVLGLRIGDLPFPLDPLVLWESVYRPPVEWAGTMPDMDWLATGLEVEWLLQDPASGRENMEIDWRFHRGEQVKLRLINDRSALHAMQHPIHLHGQRFLVLTVNGEPASHAAWKDTVLVPVGSVVDILVEMENPGPWMLHCHIAEHMETGMMTVIQVDP